jgi:hypothetical protein
MKKMSTINTKQLTALANANAIKFVAVRGTEGGFTIVVDGNLIEAKRGHPRVFRKLQTAAAYLKINGIGTFTVDISKWNPEQQAIH